MKVLRLIFWIFKDYRPLFFFSILSVIFALGGFALGVPVIVEFTRTGLVPHFPSAILATGLMIFSLILFGVGVLLDTVVKLNREQFEINLLRYDSQERFRK